MSFPWDIAGGDQFYTRLLAELDLSYLFIGVLKLMILLVL
jgi:hypothetical protein